MATLADAYTPLRLAELQAVADGERARLCHQGPWLDKIANRELPAEQARTLEVLQVNDLIATARSQGREPIFVGLTVKGQRILREWRNRPEECGCHEAGQCLTSTGCEHCRVYGDESCGLDV